MVKKGLLKIQCTTVRRDYEKKNSLSIATEVYCRSIHRLVKYAGSGDSSDEARFRHFAATSLMMANQIGVARTILANLPITRHSQNCGRPLLGYVPHRAYRVRRDPEPETPPDSPESTTNNPP